MMRLAGCVISAVGLLSTGTGSAQAAENAPGPRSLREYVTAPQVPAAQAGSPRAMYEASLGQPPLAYQPPGHLGWRWRGNPGYVAGASRYSAGEFISDDFVFDDTGGDTVPGNGEPSGTVHQASTLVGVCEGGVQRPTNVYGDYRYPSGPQYGGGNAADLVEFRVAADGSSYHLLWILETMVDPNVAAAAAGISPPRYVPPPGATGLAAFQHVIQASGDGASLDGHPIPYAVDVKANTIEVSVPVSQLPAGAWRVAAATGINAGGGKLGTVTDLAFASGDPMTEAYNCWNERTQSQEIASGHYPTATVDTTILKRGGASPAPPTTGATSIRLYRPHIDLGEGITGQPRYGQTSVANIYRGTLQEYSIYVPRSYHQGRPAPLILQLHCLNCTHNVYNIASQPGLAQLAEKLGAVLVTPLAYGEGGHYEAEAEYDAFDVLADVSARYSIDRERLLLSGFSMGSLGSFRLASLYPDLWAGAFTGGNYTTPFCVTATPSTPNCSGFNYYTTLANLRNIPWGMVNGALDELTPVTASEEYAQRFTALGYAYELAVLPLRTHDPRIPGWTIDLSGPWLQSLRRVQHPHRVTYLIDETMWTDQMGFTYDRDSWLRDIAVAPGRTKASLDGTTGRGTAIGLTPLSAIGSDGAGPWSLRGSAAHLQPVTGGNTLDLALGGVSGVTIDLAGAELTGAPIRLTVVTDTPVLVRFSDGRSVQVNPAQSGSTIIV